MAAKAAKEEKARLDRAAQLAAQQANRERKAREKKERNDKMRHLDILENKHQKPGILDSVPTIGGGVVAPDGVQGAPVKDVAVVEKAVDATKSDKERFGRAAKVVAEKAKQEQKPTVGREPDEVKSSTQQARAMEELAQRSLDRAEPKSSTQHAVQMNAIEKKQRQKQINSILADTDDNFHMYEGIPVAPDGVSIDKNIKDAEEFKNRVKGLPAYESYLQKINYILDRFPNKKPMDYKQQGRVYERFGNFNYGAVMNALGMSELTAKAGAGYAQYKAGTAKGRWALTFGDSPKDQWDIEQGYNYYEKNSSK